MKRKKYFFPIITTLLVISLILFILSTQGVLRSVPFVHAVFAPLQRGLLTQVQKVIRRNDISVETLHATFLQVEYKKLQEDNAALQNQFQTTSLPAKQLIPAQIVGMPGFIPGKTAVEQFVIDKGSHDGIAKDMAVVYKDNLIGKIVEVTNGFARISVVSNTAIAFPAKTLETKALGVVKGQGSGEILLDSVVLDQSLKKNDLVVTSGNLTIQGKGFPADLVVGRISGIEKDPSALFQRASVKSLLDVTTLGMVFIIAGK